MSRAILSLTAAALLACVSSAAHAITYGQFCATWRAQFEDGAGGDYLTDNGDAEGDFPAAYAQFKIIIGATQYDGYLNSTGCATILMTSTGTYYFNVYTKARASGLSVGPVTVHVQPQCTDGWTTTQTYVTQGIFHVINLLPGTGHYNYLQPAMSMASRDMPLFGKAINKATALSQLGNISNLYSRVSHNTEALCAPNAPYNCTRTAADGVKICVSSGGSDRKFMLAHEFGHVVSQKLGGPQPGSALGDEGAYNAQYPNPPNGICDATVARPGAAHAFMSREFIGVAASEGFGHFISSAILNSRSAAGEFVYYNNVMNSITGNPNALPPCSGNPWCDSPSVPLDNSGYVTWAEWECDPIGMTTEHLGTEWDWLRFYWSIWTGSPLWNVDEIEQMWDDVAHDNQGSLCCPSVLPGNPYPPTGCVKTNHGTGCGTSNEEIVGKLWATGPLTDAAQFGVTDSVTDQVMATYPPGTKRDRFINVGDYAKVNY